MLEHVSKYRRIALFQEHVNSSDAEIAYSYLQCVWHGSLMMQDWKLNNEEIKNTYNKASEWIKYGPIFPPNADGSKSGALLIESARIMMMHNIAVNMKLCIGIIYNL